MPSPAITVENVTKRYTRTSARKATTLMAAALAGWRRRAQETLLALDNVSFTIAPGEMMGVIGANGAGKSTLLKLLAGVLEADDGRVGVSGRIGALLQLGAGFSGDLTGRENIYYDGLMAGLTRQEALASMDSIIEFAELSDFIDSPLRTYSSGMKIRLGFASAIHARPEVLLIDEVLAVGDQQFQDKCKTLIQDLRNQGCAIVLVTQDTSLVEKNCDRALWLHRGRIQQMGHPIEVADAYREAAGSPGFRLRQDLDGTSNTAPNNASSDLISEIRVTGVHFEPAPPLNRRSALTMTISFQTRSAELRCRFRATLFNEQGLNCLSATSGASEAPALPEGPGAVALHFERLHLAAGEYRLRIRAESARDGRPLYFYQSPVPLIIEGDGPPTGGLLDLDCRWQWNP